MLLQLWLHTQKHVSKNGVFIIMSTAVDTRHFLRAMFALWAAVAAAEV